MKWKEAKAARTKREPTEGSKAEVTAIPQTAPNAKREELSAKQESLGSSWNHVVRGCCVVMAATSPHNSATARSLKVLGLKRQLPGKAGMQIQRRKITVGPKQTAVPKTK